MATTVNKWHDGSNFAFAYAVYDDQKLTVPAADGWYSFGGIVRRQLSGNLDPYANC